MVHKLFGLLYSVAWDHLLRQMLESWSWIIWSTALNISFLKDHFTLRNNANMKTISLSVIHSAFTKSYDVEKSLLLLYTINGSLLIRSLNTTFHPHPHSVHVLQKLSSVCPGIFKAVATCMTREMIICRGCELWAQSCLLLCQRFP